MKSTLGDKKALFIFMAPTLIIFIYIIIVSIVKSLNYSFFEWDGITDAVFVGLSNYKELFTNPDTNFWPSFFNSLFIAFMSVFVQIPIALVLALILRSGIRGEKIYRTIFFIPVIISSVVIGQLWLKIYHPNYGLLNTVLEALGLESWQRAWLGDENTALGAVTVPMIWQYIGYHMLLLYTAAKNVPEELYEAAKVDGASGARTAISITIPQLKPMFKACILFAVIGSFKSFDMIYVLTNGGPNGVTEVPSILMYKNIFTRYSYGFGSSVAIVIVLECLIVTVIIQSIFNKLKD